MKQRLVSSHFSLIEQFVTQSIPSQVVLKWDFLCTVPIQSVRNLDFQAF